MSAEVSSKKIVAIQGDLSSWLSLGFVRYKTVGSDEWIYPKNGEGDGLWNWNDVSGDSPVINLDYNEYLTKIYWYRTYGSDFMMALKQLN